MLIEEGEIKGKVKCCNEVQVDWIVNKVRYKTQTETGKTKPQKVKIK